LSKKLAQIFVSMGSTSITAHIHRECGIRKAAFPFDWLVSFDGQKLIKILEDGFLDFLNPDILEVSGQAVLNHYYHLEPLMKEIGKRPIVISIHS
jgi:hypothetical protein